MAQFSIDITGKDTVAPTVGNSVGTLSSRTYTYNTSNFITNFTDGDGDSYGEVVIEQLPSIGKLTLLGVDVVVGDTFHADNASGLKLQLGDEYSIYNGIIYRFKKSLDLIIADYDMLGYKLTDNTIGTLTFTNLDEPSDEFSLVGEVVDSSNLTITFAIRDNSATTLLSNTATVGLTPTGSSNVKAVYVNNPPTIGDNTLSTKYNQSIIFTRGHFVEDTDPRFNDPEGDQPYQLKILSLPSNGILYLRDVAVTINQELLFVGDIDQAVFKYVPDSSRTDIASVAFDFTVNDTGSKIYA